MSSALISSKQGLRGTSCLRSPCSPPVVLGVPCFAAAERAVRASANCDSRLYSPPRARRRDIACSASNASPNAAWNAGRPRVRQAPRPVSASSVLSTGPGAPLWPLPPSKLAAPQRPPTRSASSAKTAMPRISVRPPMPLSERSDQTRIHMAAVRTKCDERTMLARRWPPHMSSNLCNCSWTHTHTHARTVALPMLSRPLAPSLCPCIWWRPATSDLPRGLTEKASHSHASPGTLTMHC